MANPQLTADQRLKLFKPLWEHTLTSLEKLANGDPDVLFALRRKLAKELTYLERGTPSARNKLKALKRVQQKGLCAICKQALPQSHTELDRIEAKKGYTPENTSLVHHGCHVAAQRRKKYK